MIYSMDVFVMIKLQFQPQRIKKGSTLRVLELKKLFPVFLKSESLLHRLFQLPVHQKKQRGHMFEIHEI